MESYLEDVAPEPMREEKPAGPNDRIMAIDALRGFDMFWIVGGKALVLGLLAIFLNPMPEAVSRQFQHVAWEGFVAWDLIMPLFLFIVGASMPFSFGKRMAAGHSKKKIYAKVIRRTIILFVLGMVAQGNLLDFDLSTLHIYCNTLQSIAIGYLVAALLLLNAPMLVQGVVTALLLGLFYVLMMFTPLEGLGMGALAPEANLALYVDDFILRGFSDGTSYTWILSSLGFAATTLLGVFAGHILKAGWNAWMKLLALVIAGAACLALGWGWSLHFPIIKHLWTSSMVLWAGGWSFLLLALFYLILDLIGFRKWSFFFVVIGMNSIFIYMLHHVIDCEGFVRQFAGGLAGHLGAYGDHFIGVMTFVLVWLLLHYMYRKGTFIRV